MLKNGKLIKEIEMSDNIVTKEWRLREDNRMRDGMYKEAPWIREDWYLDSPFAGIHYAHTSENNVNLVAYTPDYDKGTRDVRTSVKPRKYLTKYFLDVLGEDGVERWANSFMTANSDVLLKVARTRSEIRWVYQNGQIGCNAVDDDGTGSCMTYRTEHYDCSPIHPVEAYASEDLGVAYTTRENGTVSARVVVWPDKLRYSKIYGRHGHEDKLRSILKDLGWESHGMWGARMLRIDCHSGVVAPYLDGETDVELRSDDIMIGGTCCEHVADSQRGMLNPAGEPCYDCDAMIEEDCSYTVNGGDRICQSCYEQSYFECESCNEDYHNDSSVATYGGDGALICDGCIHTDYTHCNTCDEWKGNDDIAGEYKDDYICDSCVDNDDDLERLDCGAVADIEITTVTYEVKTSNCSCCGEQETREEV
jgi:hypothetical protein